MSGVGGIMIKIKNDGGDIHGICEYRVQVDNQYIPAMSGLKIANEIGQKILASEDVFS